MTNENTTPIVASATFAEPVLSLQIGRTGEKAKFQGRLVSLDLASLPIASIAFALTYGLKQYIADGTAGSEDQSGYDLGVDLRIQKLMAGDFTRASGERASKPDSVESRAKKMATQAIRDKLAATGQKADKAKIAEAASKMVANQPIWMDKARKALADEAKAIEGIDLGDFMDDLLGLVE